MQHCPSLKTCKQEEEEDQLEDNSKPSRREAYSKWLGEICKSPQSDYAEFKKDHQQQVNTIKALN